MRWKEIIGYEGIYEVSDSGLVKSLERVNYQKNGRTRILKEKIRKASIAKNGYSIIRLYKNDVGESVYVHRLVATAFIENPKDKREVNHLDGNKTNNHVENLEWVSSKENKIHAISIGLDRPLKGEDAGRSILTEDKVRALLRLFRINPGFSKKQIAKKLGVAPQTIQCVIRRRNWVHVTI